MSLGALLIGGIGGLLAIYAREAAKKANEQKIIAIKLKAYLTYWKTLLLDSDYGMYLVLIEKYEAQIAIIYKNVGISGVVDHKKYLKDFIKNSNILTDADVSKMKDEISLTSAKQKELIYDWVKTTKQNFLDNKIFISDNEAAMLGVFASYFGIELKMRAINALDGLSALILELENLENEESNKKIETAFKNIFTDAFAFLVCLNKLLKFCDSEANKTIFKRTLENMFR